MNCPYTIDQIFNIALNAFFLGAAFMGGLWFVIWWRDQARIERERAAKEQR